MMLCGCGGIGRRAGFRFQWATVQVRVLSSAPGHNNLNPVMSGNGFGFSVYLECAGKGGGIVNDTAVF